MPPSGLLEQVRGLVGAKVDEVERSLVSHLDDCPSYLRDAALSVLQRGGKRLRPYLHLLSAELLGYAAADDVLHATVVEYLHVASLVHDDVIDEAPIRRGGATLNEEIGNTRSVLVGDYLCVKALGLAAASGRLDVHELVTRTTLDLIAGESLQETLVGRLDVTEEECLRVIELKTGRLMAASCETAALLANAGTEVQARLRDYGVQLGLAFQLTDDILDFASDEQTLGKPVLTDLREGKLTLPAVRALQAGGQRARDVLSTVVSDRGFDRVTPAEIVQLVRDTGGLEAAAERARVAAAEARTALEGLPPGPPLEALRFASEYAVSRTF